MISANDKTTDRELSKQQRRQYGFWAWLILPDSARGGRSRWLNWVLLVHAVVGICLAMMIQGDIAERARSVILPLAGVLVGLTFAWSATAISIISSKEFRRLMEKSDQGVRGTANYFQLAILAVLSCTILWAIAGMGPYRVIDGLSAQKTSFALAVFLFGFTSFAVTECWSAINLTRLTLLGYVFVREISDREEEAKDAESKLPA